jgi:zinc/manganese transport system substrate-binding protein
MLKSRYFLLLSVVLSSVMSLSAHAKARVPVVASFSVLGDLVTQIGKPYVDVTTIVGPDSDVHVYRPRPQDAKAVTAAKLLVVNGLGLEGWIPRLEQSAGFKGVTVVASTGIKTRQMPSEDDPTVEITDPHAWNSVKNVEQYVVNIKNGLIQADPTHQATYEKNTQAYLNQLKQLSDDIHQQIQSIPQAHRTMITSHDAFQYYGHEYGIHFLAPQGVSTESEPSAADVASIISQIRQQHIPAIFMENITNNRVIEQIARETGTKIGGKLYSDALSPANGPASHYIDFMRYNTTMLVSALR